MFSRKQEVVVMKLTLIGFSVKLEKSTVCQLATWVLYKNKEIVDAAKNCFDKSCKNGINAWTIGHKGFNGYDKTMTKIYIWWLYLRYDYDYDYD